jgi:hypothetical protein
VVVEVQDKQDGQYVDPCLLAVVIGVSSVCSDTVWALCLASSPVVARETM